MNCSSSYCSPNDLFNYIFISSISNVPLSFSSKLKNTDLDLYSSNVHLFSINILSCFSFKSPTNAAFDVTLLHPCNSEESPIIIFGIIIPTIQPKTTPMQSPHIGVPSTLVKSSIIAPKNVPIKHPIRSDYVLPYPANTLASSDPGNILNHSSKNDAPKKSPPLSIKPNIKLENNPTITTVKLNSFSSTPLINSNKEDLVPFLYLYIN